MIKTNNAFKTITISGLSITYCVINYINKID